MSDTTIDFKYGERVSRYTITPDGKTNHSTLFVDNYTPGDHLIDLDNPDMSQVRRLEDAGKFTNLHAEELFAEMFVYKQSIHDLQNGMRKLYALKMTLNGYGGEDVMLGFDDFFAGLEKQFDAMVNREE